MGIADRIADIEKEISRTQKNKATEYHIGLLKARLAKLRSELIELSHEASGKGEGFEVSRCGNARVVLIGFPSVGKSTLLSSLTDCESEVAAYEFTTLTCIPGMLEYNDTKIQLLDLPGIIEGASQGTGRGRQVLSVARTADLILILLDALDGNKQIPLLVKELEACGIRLNKRKPNIYFKIKKSGGVKISKSCPLTNLTDKFITQILCLYKIHNAEIVIREDCTDGIVYNKIDRISIEDIDILAHQKHSVVISLYDWIKSCNYQLNFEYLLKQIWQYLSLIRVYTKRPGEIPDFSEPLILKTSSSVKDAVEIDIMNYICNRVGIALSSDIQGRSVKYNPQRVGAQHILSDED
ncbi:LOW QUALITY PROTEIN: hypothetical protein MXB_302, partial [Myxobolus squamalis]